MVTKTGIFSQILMFFIVIFACKPNQSISTALWRERNKIICIKKRCNIKKRSVWTLTISTIIQCIIIISPWPSNSSLLAIFFLFTPPLTSIGSLSANLFTKACWDVWCDEGLEWGEERESRVLVFVLPDRAPVSWDEQMVDLAGTRVAQAHPQEGTNTRLPPSLWIPPSHSLSHIHSAALISTTCPHLSECMGGQQYGFRCVAGFNGCGSSAQSTSISFCHYDELVTFCT